MYNNKKCKMAMIIRQIIPLRWLLLIMMLISTASGWAVTKTKMFVFGNNTLNKVALTDSISENIKFKIVTVDGFRFVFRTNDYRGITFSERGDSIFRIVSATGGTYDIPFTITAPEAVTMTYIKVYNYLPSSYSDAYQVNVEGEVPSPGKTTSRTPRRSYSRIDITYDEALLSTPSFSESLVICADSSSFTNVLNGIPEGYTGKITYSSTDETVATVDAAGKVTPTGKAGLINISAVLENNKDYMFKPNSLSYILHVPLAFNADNVLQISSVNDWLQFANIVNSGNTAAKACLTRDIELGKNYTQGQLGSMVVGNRISNAYQGIFDGQGHTISLDWELTSSIHLFENIRDAVIKNVRFDGKIYVTGSDLAPIGEAYGSIEISNIVNNVDYSINPSDDRSGNCAGLIKTIRDDATVTISNCIVSGKFESLREYSRKGVSGFVSNQYGSCTLNSCLYVGSNNATDWSYTFAKNSVTNNCFYLNACGNEQGELVTEKQLKNGYVLSKLGAAWAQTLGEMPAFYDNSKIFTENYVRWDTDGWLCTNFYANDTLSIGMDFFANYAEFYRSFTAGKAHTVALPYDWYSISSSSDDDYHDKVYVLSEIDGDVAHFVEAKCADNGKYEAYRPYLIIPAFSKALKKQGILIKAEPETPVTIEKNGVKWCATYAGMSNAEAAAAGAYILQSDGIFHKVTTENTNAVIPPYRAYITLPDGTQAKALSLSFGDNTTGLRAIETTDRDGTVRYYDMQGRYIGTSLDGQPRGIYVKDGKKIMKK